MLSSLLSGGHALVDVLRHATSGHGNFSVPSCSLCRDAIPAVVTRGRRMLYLKVFVGMCSLMASHNLSLNRVQMESMDEAVLTFSRISWCIAFSAALILSQLALL